MARKKKWIQKAIKRPGALRKKMGAKDGIPTAKLKAKKKALQKKAKGEKKLTPSELRTLRQINLALLLRRFPKRGRKKKRAA